MSVLQEQEPTAMTGRTPSDSFDIVPTMPSASFSPCVPPRRRLDALATGADEKCRPGRYCFSDRFHFVREH